MMGFPSARREATRLCNELQDYAGKVLEMGRSDRRKVIFAAKMGLALAVVSLLLFWVDLFPELSQYAIWAILTVVVMFEFSIGATLIKGFNRGLGTIFAGAIAFGFAKLATLSGPWEKVVIVASIFIIGLVAAYLKLYPTMLPYEYGFRVFVMTYCILMVAGNRSRDYTEAIVTRLVLIAVGAGVCFLVNTCIYPIWAGDDLHRLVVRNFRDAAASLEGCVNGYLNCFEYPSRSRIVTYEAFDHDPLHTAYKSVLESTNREQTLLGFAIWEPPHGRYKVFNYPWRNYVKLSGALRHCVFMVMALHGCILSEIQAPPEQRWVFASELERVGVEGARVLRELGDKVEKMEKLSPLDILQDVHEAAQQLQKRIIDQKSQLLMSSSSSEKQQPKELEDSQKLCRGEDEDKRETVVDVDSSAKSEASAQLWSSFIAGATKVEEDELKKWGCHQSASALSLATFASLLIEFVARLQHVVRSFQELSDKANFKNP
ncbi:aluminum-activated malate transporter 9 [Diospyros lotus]|uniref:aluminum-activated malate transporter 9 n=1 Tax=Diospyros lotus TaxID=55363 RepID=UPI0022541893|nr:aluminum-activated malate transporter 9 [Diospyros lotus]